MDPPGGVWQKADPKGHYKAGDPILLFTNARRYKVFFYCNSTAFVASLVVILMVQNKSLIRGHALEVAMILDLFGLIGAYAAGSCRDVSTSIYVMALAGAVLVYVVIHVVFFTLDNEDLSDEEKRSIDKQRKRLLLLAILVATVTYQAGLTPPGGFWTADGTAEDGTPTYNAGSAILEDYGGEYRRRYLAFFYCNSTSFMASVALIIMLVNPNLYRPGIRCYALYVCMVVALFGLMGAYAAGSARELLTSIYVFVLVGAVVAFIVVQLLVFFKFFNGCGASSSGSTSGGSSSNNANDSLSSPRPQSPEPSTAERSSSSRRKYLMLLAILAASVTYQAGLKPPGGTWEESVPDSHITEGNPVLRVSDLPRFRAFFYCNSASFVASVVVIVLLLQESLQDRHGLLIYAMNTAIVLDLLGLLGAYAAGSSREWDTSGYVIALTAAVLAYVAVHIVIWFVAGRRGRRRVSSITHQLPAEARAQPKETTRCWSSGHSFSALPKLRLPAP
jgi:zinc transporter ZupT